VESVDSDETRKRVMAILQEHDPQKVNKIDAIMERFKGRESFLLMKMSDRYKINNIAVQVKPQSRDDPSESSGRSKLSASKRSEMALARHLERMKQQSPKT